MQICSSASHKWGCFLDSYGEWQAAGFFKTEREATQFALDTHYPIFIVARRFTRAQALNTKAGRK